MTNNTNVDVLAVLDDAIEREEDAGGIYFLESLKEARAAVAELIAANIEYDRAYADALGDFRAPDSRNGQILEKRLAAKARRDAALAGVGGGK